ncbi:hypothetical protein Taro_046147 [Colocasia esculenta]|uniref:Uncharacterized protein n=1 Tax=Colocasia esculenta TaxID=4460 RepID=A0A843WRG7_COLES|nr:hypothetical protein [Colocasia esculenta]
MALVSHSRCLLAGVPRVRSVCVKATCQLLRSPETPACVTRGLEAVCLSEDLWLGLGGVGVLVAKHGSGVVERGGGGRASLLDHGMAPLLSSDFCLRSPQVSYRDTRQKATCNLSCSGGDRLVVAFPSDLQFLFPIVAKDGSCPSWLEGGLTNMARGQSSCLGPWPCGPLGYGPWGGSAPRALPSDEERDGSICHVLNLKATPCVSLSGCDRIHVAFYLLVATGFSSPSGFDVVDCGSADLLGDQLVLSHCISRRWFRSHIVVSGVEPQLDRAAGVHVWCSTLDF